jgi:hypothetical protein
MTKKERFNYIPTEEEQRQWYAEHCNDPLPAKCENCQYYHGDAADQWWPSKTDWHGNRQPFYCTNANTSPNGRCLGFKQKMRSTNIRFVTELPDEEEN